MRLYTLCFILLTVPAVSFAQMPTSASELTDSTLAAIRAFVPISENLATSGQVGTQHMKAIKEGGYEVIVNLAPARKEMNGEEAFAAVSEGLAYVQIPVDFRNPGLRDLEFFFQVMNANRDRKVFVHCFANMRASSFIYLYRVTQLGVPPDEAKGALNKVWEPNADWVAFIDQAMDKYGKK